MHGLVSCDVKDGSFLSQYIEVINLKMYLLLIMMFHLFEAKITILYT